MSTKSIVLRQHICGSASAPETALTLSLGEQEISYHLILDQANDQLSIVDDNAMESDSIPTGSQGCAKIRQS